MPIRRVLLVFSVASSFAAGVFQSEPAIAQSAAAPGASDSTSLDVDAWVGKLTGSDATGRKSAVASLDQAIPASLPAIARRLRPPQKTPKHGAMAAVNPRLH